ncbi:hypothetical protein [Nocardioides sp. GXQ0305]|uniref:hypothetical protein n=1 Tax=Nocardioides sp. GXQ0305 TaxID=3423912 RepID=UPI003D7DCB12
MSEFDEIVQGRLSLLQEELTAALTDDDYAGAAWVESAMLDLHRLHRENSAATPSPVGPSE